MRFNLKLRNYKNNYCRNMGVNNSNEVISVIQDDLNGDITSKLTVGEYFDSVRTSIEILHVTRPQLILMINKE